MQSICRYELLVHFKEEENIPTHTKSSRKQKFQIKLSCRWEFLIHAHIIYLEERRYTTYLSDFILQTFCVVIMFIVAEACFGAE